VTYTTKAVVIRLPQQVFRPSLQDNKALSGSFDFRNRVSQIARQLRTEQDKGSSAPRSILGSETAGSSKQTQAVLIQPEYPLDLQLPPASPVVPSALIWTSQTSRMPPKPFVVPGPVTRQVPTPVMQQPTEDIPFSARLEVPESASLNAAVLQLPPKGADSKQNTTASDTNPVALLSVSNASATSNLVVVPPGNLIPSAADSESKDGVHRGSTSVTGHQSSAPAVNTKGEYPGTSADSVLSSRTGNSSSTNIVSSHTSPAQSAVLAPKTELAKSATTQAQGLNHPANGRFDIVVIQSSADDSLPAGTLSGKPVYTVYLHVGDTVDWIMHYCASNSFAVQKGGVVQLPDPRPLNAPYPRLTFLPDEPVAGPGPYILVHGTIDESGSLQDLQVIGPMQSGNSSLLVALSKWRFRPAMRAESPEKIEMVLAIPVQKT
jgi:hypothetical protein